MASDAAVILSQIAKDLNKPISTVQPFIQSLEDNWFDSRDALKQMSDQDFDKLKIPLRIASLIREKVKQEQPTNIPVENTLELQLALLKSCFQSTDDYLKCLNTMHKIITNQFYQIKLQSKTLQQQILAYQPASDFMGQIGWKKQGEVYQLSSQDMESIRNAADLIQIILSQHSIQEKPKFNPYQASFQSTVGLTNADIANKEGYQVFDFSNQLERLKMKRFVLRNNVYHSQKQRSESIQRRKEYFSLQFIFLYVNMILENMMQQIAEQDDYEDLQPNNDPVLRGYLKQIAQSLETENFASKRKKEYEQLIKSDIYSETIIRVKMPGDIIFEAKFSPMETIQQLYKLMDEYLADKSIQYYIYMTPPVVKLVKQYLTQTFDDLQCVPNGLFYFGCVNQADESKQLLKDGLIKDL